MKTMNVSEARNTLPELIESVSSTRKPVMLLRYGRPAAMLVPVVEAARQASPHPLRGLPIEVSEDFDAPMPDLWEVCGVAEENQSYQTSAKKPGGAHAKRSRP